MGWVWERESGPHRPRVARLLPGLVSSALGSLHSLQNAAVGVGGLNGPLDKAVLVDSLDDAVRETGEGLSWSGGSAQLTSLPITAARPACLLAPDSGLGHLDPPPPSVPFCSYLPTWAPASAQPYRNNSCSAERPLQTSSAPPTASCLGPIPGKVERQW